MAYTFLFPFPVCQKEFFFSSLFFDISQKHVVFSFFFAYKVLFKHITRNHKILSKRTSYKKRSKTGILSFPVCCILYELKVNNNKHALTIKARSSIFFFVPCSYKSTQLSPDEAIMFAIPLNIYSSFKETKKQKRWHHAFDRYFIMILTIHKPRFIPIVRTNFFPNYLIIQYHCLNKTFL